MAVTRNHHHADAGVVAFRDGLFGLLARRIVHTRQTDEHEIMLHGVHRPLGGRGVVQIPIGRAEYAQRLLRHHCILRRDVLAISGRHRPDPTLRVAL
jgi:hypothetical protein